MYPSKLRVSELKGKENVGMLGNRHLKSHDYHNQLKKIPFPVEQFEASDLSSIISESQLKSKEVFDALISKKQSLRNFIEETSNTIAASEMANYHKLQQNNTKRTSIEGGKRVNAALKSMLSDKNSHGNYFSEIDSLRETNYKLIQENKNLKQQLDRINQQHKQQQNLNSRFESQSSQVRNNNYETTPTAHGNSFDSFEKLEQSNRLLRNKLNLSKRNEQQILEKYEKLSREVSHDKHHINHSTDSEKNGVFNLSSIYLKAFSKGRMPQLESFAAALKSYFQEFEQTFCKINIMFENMESSHLLSEKYLQTKQMVNLLKIPVLYKNKPKMVDSLLNMSKSGVRQQSRDKQRDTRPITEAFSPELLSGEDTITMLEQVLAKVLKSNNMMRLCRENRSLMGLIARVRS